MNTILTILMITVMTYEMPKLPYTNNALEPVISQQAIDYHYGKHLTNLCEQPQQPRSGNGI